MSHKVPQNFQTFVEQAPRSVKHLKQFLWSLIECPTYLRKDHNLSICLLLELVNIQQFLPHSESLPSSYLKPGDYSALISSENMCTSLILLHLLTDYRRNSLSRKRVLFKFYLLKQVRVPVVAVIMVLLFTLALSTSCRLRISFQILAKLQQAAVCQFISLSNFSREGKQSSR